MMRFMFKSKIHRAKVTATDKDYEGSITVDANLLEAADILPYEQVHVWDITRGTRILTYAIAGEAGSGAICVNGAGAHLVSLGDLVIIAAFTELDDAAARSHRPKIILVDGKNRMQRNLGNPS
jgi:aspartate 1-decarboxylase